MKTCDEYIVIVPVFREYVSQAVNDFWSKKQPVESLHLAKELKSKDEFERPVSLQPMD